MTDNILFLAALGLFLSTVTTYAAVRSKTMLATCNAVCIVSGLLLGRATLGFAAMPFSSGAPFIAVAIFGLVLKRRIYGAREASNAIQNIMVAALVVFGSLFILDSVDLLSPLFDPSIRRAGARLVCLYLIQVVLFGLLNRPSKRHPLLRLPMLIIAMEILEGVIFYPAVLLGERDLLNTFEYTAFSVALRIFTTLTAIPCLAALLYMERKGWVSGIEGERSPAAAD